MIAPTDKVNYPVIKQGKTSQSYELTQISYGAMINTNDMSTIAITATQKKFMEEFKRVHKIAINLPTSVEDSAKQNNHYLSRTVTNVYAIYSFLD